ncbi:ATP-binding cassette domain-containing protein [Salmonella enterica]|nr:ATP-binding cassette domain-containing protein [Salmonella enterica]EAX3609111.1 ATP-binding cassette domain-containing protein [Salmonella enterica]EGW6282683.1 ATP-binding cassette domain-containing protein [Salmonella enterica]EGX3935072.1 ATP-binding cassette domain-containing protein [Salmonella enterica]
MSTPSEECYSFIQTYQDLAKELRFVVTPESISNIINLYPVDGNFSDVLNFVGEVSGIRFIKVNNANNNTGCFIYLHDGKWFFTKSLDKGKKQNSYLCIPAEFPEKISFLKIINLWIENKYRFYSIFLTSFFLSLTALAIPLYMNAVYGKIFPAFAESSLWSLSLLLFAFFMLDVYFKNKKIELYYDLISSFSSYLEPRYLRILVHLISSKNNDWGKKRTHAIQSLYKIKNLMWLFLTYNALDMFFCIVYFVTIALISGYLVIVPMCIALIFILSVIIINSYTVTNEESNSLNEVFYKIPYLSHYHAEGKNDYFISSYMNDTIKLNQNLKKEMQNKNNISSLASFLSSFQTIVIIIVSFYMVKDGLLSMGAIFATVILSGKIIQSISPLPHLIFFMKQITSSFSVINSVLPTNIESSTQLHNHKFDVNSDKPYWSFFNCSVAYDEQYKILDNINVKIYKGEKVAIVGPQGCGKSTFIQLLLGNLKPVDGNVTCFDNEGFLNFSSKSFYASQNDINTSSIFDYFDCDIEKTKKALSLPFMNWVKIVFDNGIYLPPSDFRLKSLTFERKQLIDLSRLLVSEKEIFILDEPATSLNIDSVKIFNAFLKKIESSDKTLIISTNKREFISHVDRVIYINDGKISFDGSSENFLSNIK